MTILMMVSIYKLGTALDMSVTSRILFMLGTLIPLLGLILLLVINQKATSYLNRCQIKVGLMGAKLSDLPQE